MKKNFLIITALAVLLLSVSCTSLADYYTPSARSVSIAILPEGFVPDIRYTDDIDQAAADMTAKGYVEIGRISYVGYSIKDAEEQLLKICREKQAAVAVYNLEITQDISVDYSRGATVKNWYKAVFFALPQDKV